MRTKKPFLIALFLCTWSLVSYYLLIRQTDSTNNNSRHGSITSNDHRHQREELLRQLNRLETNIQEENVIHDQLVKKLIEIARLKDKDIDKHNKVHAAVAVNKPILTESQTANHGDGIDKPIPNESNRIIDSLKSPISNNDVNLSNTELEPVDADAQVINRLNALNKRKSDFKGPIIPVLVFACNRISVRNCLDDLIKYRPNVNQFPIIVSQVMHLNIHIPLEIYC